MRALHAERLRVDKRALEAGAELLAPFRKDRDAALALGEIAGRMIEEGDRQPVPLDARGDLLRRKIIRKEKLHGLETGVRRRREAVEELPFVEHHRQVRGETRHGKQPSFGTTYRP